MEAPLDPIFFEEFGTAPDIDVEEYVPALDPGAENYRRIQIEQARKESARARLNAAVEAARMRIDPTARKFGTRPTTTMIVRDEPEIVQMKALPEAPEGSYSAGYSVVEPINNVPEVLLSGTSGSTALTVTPRAKAIKNAESTPVARTVKILKKQAAAAQSVVAGADRVRAIQHDSFCSEMKREAMKKIAKYLSQLPPKQQVVYEARLNRLANWRKSAKAGKAGTPKELEAVNLKALMKLSFFLEKKALYYASVDLRRAARHSNKCSKVFAGKRKKKLISIGVGN